MQGRRKPAFCIAPPGISPRAAPERPIGSIPPPHPDRPSLLSMSTSTVLRPHLAKLVYEVSPNS